MYYKRTYNLTSIIACVDKAKLCWKEINKIKDVLGKHNVAIANILRKGENWGGKEETRIRNTLQESTTMIPQLSSQAKDHKAIPESAIQKTSGVTGASRMINQRLY